MKKAERELLMRQKLIEMSRYEKELYNSGVKFIGGVDEVGRGPLAGPVTAACVVLPEDWNIIGLDDSKKLTEKRRNEMYGIIIENALAYGIAMRDNNTIDEINILEATKEAMAEAIDRAQKMLEERQQGAIGHVLFDAVTLKDLDCPQTALIKGDSKSISIAAASIVAKVTRDNLMCEYSLQYPGYAFEKNKGYGTKAHYQGIEEQGITPIHRKTFLKKILGE